MIPQPTTGNNLRSESLLAVPGQRDRSQLTGGSGDGAPPRNEPGRMRQSAIALMSEVALAIRWRLHRVGISLDPYYWTMEGADAYVPPPTLDSSRYRFIECDLDDETLDAEFPPDRLLHLAQCREGRWALFAIHDGTRVVAFISLRFDEAPVFGFSRPLSAGEAYVIWVYTTPDARGRGLAAQLRHLCFCEMHRRGVTRLYSYIDAMNEAGMRTARKVGLRPLELWLHLGLGRRNWHIPLRRRLS